MKSMKFFNWAFLLVVFISLSSCKEDNKQEKDQNTTDEGPIVASILEEENSYYPINFKNNGSEFLAYTWFGRPNYAYSETAKKYWIGSTKDTPKGTTQHVTEYDINKNTFITIKVGTVYEKDDHNQAQILIRSSDKRLIAVYTSHNDSLIRYKISASPLDASAWGAEQTINPGGDAYSYPSPYEASNGDIFIFYRRRGESQWAYSKSTDGGLSFNAGVDYWHTYGGTKNLYNITSQSDIDKNILHFVATDQHISYLNLVPVDIWHFYLDLSTEIFYTSDGTKVTTLPLDLTLNSKIVDVEYPDSSWIADVIIKDGMPRVLYYFYPEGVDNHTQFKDLYFIEWTGSSWTNPKFIIRELDGYIEDDEFIDSIAYPSASRFDTTNPDIVWSSIQVNGILEMHKIDISTNPIYFEQITFDSEMNNWRPISVPSPVKNLLWLKINDYNYYKDYSMELQTKTVK